MQNEWQIARATLADAAAILALQRCAYQSEATLYQDWSLPPLLETLEQLQAQFATTVLLKAEWAGELIGAVRGQGVCGRCAVGRLIVRPDLQGRGIGRALMQQIEAEFPQAECFELFTGSRSERNIRLYESLGYRQCRVQAIGDMLTLVWMEKCRASA
jgi:ribosomal protein S18 acetylase RimI-like enzyme